MVRVCLVAYGLEALLEPVFEQPRGNVRVTVLRLDVALLRL
jgi:hypothetical protein